MQDYASLIYLGLLFVVILGWFARFSVANLGKTLQMILIWGLIFLGTIAAYGLWDDISAELFVARSNEPTLSENSISVPRQRDGHFYLTLDINGTPVRFLTDTGATDLVLTKQDARKIGIDVDNLAFLGIANTANGQVKTARVTLKNTEIGDFRQRNVAARVNGGDLDISLLGMSYLSRFSKIEISGNTLILRY